MVELVPSTSSSVQVPTSSKLKASVALSGIDDADMQLDGDPLQLINFWKHENMTSTGYNLQKTETYTVGTTTFPN